MNVFLASTDKKKSVFGLIIAMSSALCSKVRETIEICINAG